MPKKARNPFGAEVFRIVLPPMKDPGPKDPADWLRQAVSDDPEALDRWYRAEWPRVHRLAFGFLADDAGAQDVAQDAMIRILDEARVALPDRYLPWRTTLVANLCRDRLRQREVRRRVETAQPPFPLRPLPDPSDSAVAGEMRALIADALSRLSPREREVFVLRDLEQWDTDACARTLEIQESTVRTLLTLARRRLRDILGPRLTGEFGDVRP